jgi:hypothetical protein
MIPQILVLFADAMVIWPCLPSVSYGAGNYRTVWNEVTSIMCPGDVLLFYPGVYPRWCICPFALALAYSLPSLKTPAGQTEYTRDISVDGLKTICERGKALYYTDGGVYTKL